MRVPSVILLVAATAVPVLLAAQEETVDGSATAIRAIVSGKTCTGEGEDVLIFGKSTAGSRGTFERKGHPNGSYTIGYGTILIRRGKDLHGHVASVSVPSHVLHLSANAYRCEE